MTDSKIPHPPFKFTDARLKELKPAAARYQVRDTEQRGLVCVVHPSGQRYPNGRRVLQVYARAKGIAAPVRVNICEVGELPMTALKGDASVRARAAEILGQLRQGINPNEHRREQQAEQRRQAEQDRISNVTLGEAFELYLATKPIGPRTLEYYRLSINRDLADWKDKPLASITGQMAVSRFAELAKRSSNTAATVVKVFRAIHRFASEYYGDDDNELPFGRCPVAKVNKIFTGWAKTEARTRRLTTDDLAPWLAAVRDLPNHQRRCSGEYARVAVYMEMMLLTGLRRREAAFIRWADVDLARGTMIARDTKNGSDHTLPITARVRQLLELRRQADPNSPFIIGSTKVNRNVDLIEKQTGIRISPHDLRRTWASMADKCGTGSYGIKAALNHKSGDDVTGKHYAQVSTEDLRPIMQRVEDFILRHAEQRDDNVVSLRGAA
ncbi:tyrosine-type recombinase/integrase [Thiorhodovibrio frisius]|uniref:Site-specific recombinase XerD n=1 Tax=Thiorhodovibrio frisius TaxID=631362 RepID=H8YXW3_9GAMM|nr:tyrosine-type recombinase/integrase [Thiorhodovibrio frisius]EIC23289.1 site-specific recombinase XerD [Thiorhodovibrio frisius]WPL23633.1 integrase [Thiorhodovibrio frisius]